MEDPNHQVNSTNKASMRYLREVLQLKCTLKATMFLLGTKRSSKSKDNELPFKHKFN